uniref:Uncharacterized protein n=1 Tax=Oryza rufipogon TaxID=4529 RepID=A0A0E0P554_ORYRU
MWTTAVQQNRGICHLHFTGLEVLDAMEGCQYNSLQPNYCRAGLASYRAEAAFNWGQFPTGLDRACPPFPVLAAYPASQSTPVIVKVTNELSPNRCVLPSLEFVVLMLKA